jgi:hypothetical protein
MASTEVHLHVTKMEDIHVKQNNWTDYPQGFQQKGVLTRGELGPKSSHKTFLKRSNDPA